MCHSGGYFKAQAGYDLGRNTMSQTKYPLPNDLKMRCLSLVRGYDRMVLEYHKERNEIIYSTPKPPDGQPKGNAVGDSCYSKNELLDKLDRKFDTDAMRAVEQAKLHIGLDMANEEDRRRLTNAIWDSCIEGRNFIFEYRALNVGKTNFYERRRKFLYEIAECLQFV